MQNGKVKPLDTLPPRDFFDIFHRISALVDLKDCKNSEDIERSLKQCEKLMENAAINAKKDSTKKKWFTRRKLMQIMLKKGGVPKTALTRDRKRELRLPMRRENFAKAVIDEAIRNPKGIINDTLKHGYAKAKKMHQKRSERLGILTIHKDGLHHSRNKKRSGYQ